MRPDGGSETLRINRESAPRNKEIGECCNAPIGLNGQEAFKRNSIRYKLKEGYTLEISELFFLVSLIKENKVSKLTEDEISAIEARIYQNYPMQSIIDLENGDIIYDFTLEGIKEGNDRYKMDFVDRVIEVFERELLNIDAFDVKWSDYKNTLLKKKQKIGESECSIDGLETLIDDAFSVVLKERSKPRNTLNVLKSFSETLKLEGIESQRDLIYAIAEFKQKIAKKAAKETGKDFVEFDEIEVLEREFQIKYGIENFTYHQALDFDGNILGNIANKKVTDKETGEEIGYVRGREIFNSQGENIGIVKGMPIYEEQEDSTYEPKQVGEIIYGFYYQYFEHVDESFNPPRKFIRTEKIKLFDTDLTISSEIINFIRKGEFSGNTEFSKDLKEIINSYILNCKFIMPSKKNYESLSEGVVIEEKDQEKFKALLEWLKNYDNSFEHSEDNSDCETVSRDTSEDVNNVLDGEVINRETKEDKIAEIERLLLYNYKGFLDKKAFLDQTNGRDGTLVFVDIKSMGVENILAFRGKYRDYKEISRKLRLQISDAEREGDANKVIELKKELKKQKENVLLHSGDKVTLALWGAIQKIKQEITSQFGSDIEVGLGGDEIYFFVPDEKKGGEEELRNRYNFINSIIKEKLANYQLSGRIQMTETKKNQHPGVKEKLTQLDKATAFSKALEKRLASLLKTLGERVFAGTIVDGDDEELELQKRFVEGLHDFRLEVEPRISTLQEEEDKHKDFLGEENCKFDIVFNKVALPVNKKEYKSRFSTQDIFRVEYNEKTDEYNVELKPDSPLITVFKGINLGRTSRKK